MDEKAVKQKSIDYQREAEAPWFDEKGFEEEDTFPDLNKHERGDHALGRFLDAVGKVKALLVEGVKDTIPETIQDLVGKTLETLLPLAQKVIEMALEGVEVYGKGVNQYGGNTPPGSPRQRSQQMFQVDGEKGLQEIGLRTGQLFDQAASGLNLTPDQLDNAVFVFTLGTGSIGKGIGKKVFTQSVGKTTTKQVVNPVKIHKNSNKFVGDTHVYQIYKVENGKRVPYKIGESAQGLNKFNQSKRAEQQARKLRKETKYDYESEIMKNFNNKKDARTFETELIKSMKKTDPKALPGNKGNH